MVGHYKGEGGACGTEAVIDPDLYSWCFDFGVTESLNDIPILDTSRLVGALLTSSFDSTVPAYEINGRLRYWMYRLVGRIYQCWSIFAKTYQYPTLQANIVLFSNFCCYC